MPAFVVADDLNVAKEKFLAALQLIEDGTDFDIAIDQKQRKHGRVYPDCDVEGIELSKIDLEDEEDV